MIEVARALVWIVATGIAYAIAMRVHMAARKHPMANAVLLAVALLVGLLALTHTPYAEYARGSRPIALLLGPATVALALPLFRSAQTLRRAVRPVTIGLVVGASVALVSALVIARALGASVVVARSLAPKSVTTPIAMAVSARIGGDPVLTAVFVILTGMLGAMMVPWVFHLARVDDARARGLALGVAAHGLGTARAVSLGATEVAFAALGMGLSGVVNPILVPLGAKLLWP